MTMSLGDNFVDSFYHLHCYLTGYSVQLSGIMTLQYKMYE